MEGRPGQLRKRATLTLARYQCRRSFITILQRVREGIDENMKNVGWGNPAPDQLSTKNTIKRVSEVWAGPWAGAGGLIQSNTYIK